MSEAGRSGGPGSVDGGATRERILQATYDCVARWGLAKTTVEDAARAAGVSRATVYRYFPGGREELVEAVVGWEHARFFVRLYEAVRTARSLEEVMEQGLLFAHRAVEEHEVLQRLLITDPQRLLPAMVMENERTVSLISQFLTAYLEQHELADGVSIPEAADFLAAMVLSYIAAPGRWDLDDPAAVARLVRAELLGGIVPRSLDRRDA